MAQMFLGEELFMLVPALLSGIPSSLLGIASFVLSAIALYTIARRRGLNHAWLSWIPVANCWILGSLSDQYQYVVKGQNKSKRKVMLILNILIAVFSVTVSVLGAVTVAGHQWSAAGNSGCGTASGLCVHCLCCDPFYGFV